jgi:DNA processing protein
LEKLSEDKLQTLLYKIPDKEKPKQLYLRGDIALLEKRKIAIVGARRASKYSKTQTYLLAKKLSDAGIAVVSGAAEGIDACAHDGAGQNTIAVMPCGLDICYPEANKNLIQKIYQNSLAISEYEKSEMPRNYTFVHRNRLVVGMSEAVVITEADEKSGSMRSAEYALKYDIPLFVLAHRIDESMGTNKLLREGVAKPIFDIDSFLASLGCETLRVDDEVAEFAKSTTSFAEFFAKYGERVYEMELEGKIKIENGRVKIL